MMPALRRPIVIAMLDGFGPEYYYASEMPVLKAMAQQGEMTLVNACMPSVTNVNNASICTGEWPAVHGITANSYFDLATRQEHYMDRGEMLLAPTLFERAGQVGIKSALLTSKGKTVSLLGRGAEIALAAERPGPDWVAKLGEAPDIYSAEINHWLWRAALLVLRERPDIDLVYCHTTDYAMHMCDADGELSQFHLRELDKLFDQLLDEWPDVTVCLTADHGMNYKRRCYDLNKHMPERGCPIHFAMSAERDPYIKHHRNFGGTAYVWLKRPEDADQATGVLTATEGVEAVYGRDQAAAVFHLHPDRIGDLIVLGDAETVFGSMETASEDLPPTYRNHGSRHELAVPLVAYGPRVDLSAWDRCTSNKDLVRLLCHEWVTRP
jgi:phosphonoacetate hydrolase